MYPESADYSAVRKERITATCAIDQPRYCFLANCLQGLRGRRRAGLAAAGSRDWCCCVGVSVRDGDPEGGGEVVASFWGVDGCGVCICGHDTVELQEVLI